MRPDSRGLLRFDWPLLLAEAFRVGIKPHEFWGMGWVELRACLKGGALQMEDQRTMDAWVVSNIINVWVKETDRVSVAQLLGKQAPAVETTDAASLRERMLRKKARQRMEDV